MSTELSNAAKKQKIIEDWLAQPIMPVGKYRGWRCSAIAKWDKKYAQWFVRDVKDKPEMVESMQKALTLVSD